MRNQQIVDALLRDSTAGTLQQVRERCTDALRKNDMYDVAPFRSFIAQLIDEIDAALLSDSVDVKAKLRVVMLSKHLLTTEANYAYLTLFQAMLLPWFSGIVNYERGYPL